MLVLVAAAGMPRPIATRAFDLLQHALACPELPPELVNSAEEALLQYQAVPRLCRALPPDIPYEIDSEASLSHAERMACNHDMCLLLEVYSDHCLTRVSGQGLLQMLAC